MVKRDAGYYRAADWLGAIEPDEMRHVVEVFLDVLDRIATALEVTAGERLPGGTSKVNRG